MNEARTEDTVALHAHANGEDSAYPSPDNSQYCGLTKREIFAGMAMQGLLSNWEALARMGFRAFEVEMFAVARADALLKELAK